MAALVLSKTRNAIKIALDRALQRSWVFPAAARYGELLVADELATKAPIDYNGIQSRVQELIQADQTTLVAMWSDECKHISQMVRSGHALNYEELVALLTSLSELAFIRNCLTSLGLNELPLMETPSDFELRAFLVTQRKVYPSNWLLLHTIVLNCDGHWWWKSD